MFVIDRSKMVHACRFAAAGLGSTHHENLRHLADAVEAMPRADFVEMCGRVGGVDHAADGRPR